MWLLFAFAGPVLWAFSTHMDKYLLERYLKGGSPAVLMVFTALTGLITLPFIWWLVPSVLGVPLFSVIVIALSGLLYMAAMFFYLQALQREEASVVAPLFQTIALFSLILGYVILGETISFLQFIGALCIVAGSVLLSLKFGRGRTGFKTRMMLLMLTCSLALAVSAVIFKFFAVRDEFWSTTFWSLAGEALFAVVLLAPKSYRMQFVRVLRTKTLPVLSISAANEAVNFGGNLAMRFALLLAPLALVEAILSTAPFFVLFLGLALSLFLPALGREELGAKSLLQKGVATLLAVGGVIIINI